MGAKTDKSCINIGKVTSRSIPVRTKKPVRRNQKDDTRTTVEGRRAVLNGKRLEDQDEEVADRTLAPVTSSGCPRKRGKVRAQQQESQGPITVSVIAVSVKCTCLQGEGGDSGTSLTF